MTMTRLSKLAPSLALTFAATLGVVLGACGHSDYRIDKVCEKYCDRIYDCNDNTDYMDCVDNCVEQANECDSDNDVEQALDTLEMCAEDSCNDVIACSIDAWAECVF